MKLTLGHGGSMLLSLREVVRGGARVLLGLGLLMGISLSAGCGGGSTTPTQEAVTGKTEADQIRESMAKLSPEDRQSAERQQVCLVADAPLGTMGPPVKVKVKNRDAWICCAGCASEVEAEPEKYLAKLAKLLEPAQDGAQGAAKDASPDAATETPTDTVKEAATDAASAPAAAPEKP